MMVPAWVRGKMVLFARSADTVNNSEERGLESDIVVRGASRKTWIVS